MEVALLTAGIPYAALEKASDMRVSQWYAVLQEMSQASEDRLSKVMEG